MNQPEYKNLQTGRIVLLGAEETLQNPRFVHQENDVGARHIHLHYMPFMDQDPDDRPHQIFVSRITKLIEAHIDDETYGITRLCRDAFTCRTLVHKKIKASTGFSTSIFIRNIRLRFAKRLLLTTDLKIIEVAFEVGFKDCRYFSRLFNSNFGMSPSTFRKCWKG